MSELVGAAPMDVDVARAWSEIYAQPRRELARERLRIARRQGQMREDADLDVVVDQLWGALLPPAARARDALRRIDRHAPGRPRRYGSAPAAADLPEPSTGGR